MGRMGVGVGVGVGWGGGKGDVRTMYLGGLNSALVAEFGRGRQGAAQPPYRRAVPDSVSHDIPNR